SDYNDVLYIATSIVTDDEMESRVSNHRKSRNSKWNTFEGYKNLDKVIINTKLDYIILDCITVMVTNIIFDSNYDYDNLQSKDFDIILNKVKYELEKLITSCKNRNKTLIMVTNEVGYGIVPEYKLGRIFRDMAGYVNQFIASLCSDVYLVSCGIPLKIK
ncbi:MAG: bifunctional adenosylcobinamide kinase/adenosylcobinamide-phosphate guanylyltransferase, partial [Clostridium sp.]